MPLGMEVGLGPGDFALDGDPAPPLPQKGGAALSPVSGPCPLWPNGWMDQVALGTKVDLGACHIVLDGDPAPSPSSKGCGAPHFWTMSIAAKRLDASRCHFVWR